MGVDQIMDNALFQIIVGVAGAAVSFIAARILQAIRDVETRLDKLSDKINELEVAMAKYYVSQNQFNTVTGSLFNKIDKIEDKLSHKVDK